ncbi:hypothetical protein BN14_12364 [Rhizoctonia solani AG-1 IB]|uniref:Uncharacterized protein n=1 Tax=Thanatephorus cucumeris (strain AG1-IB / isolate 7/3/14) TaxID=1108050 RepID=M5CDZ6_THACB|nr:hypothetical protein BN14_12364 [Rhizoctonia solani AG-1 IB]
MRNGCIENNTLQVSTDDPSAIEEQETTDPIQLLEAQDNSNSCSGEIDENELESCPRNDENSNESYEGESLLVDEEDDNEDVEGEVEVEGSGSEDDADESLASDLDDDFYDY